MSKLTALATAIAWGFANSLVAQAATSRLLYAMARDRQLPAFLARVHKRKGVPVNATLLVAVVSLVLGLYFSTRDDGISLLSTLVNSARSRPSWRCTCRWSCTTSCVGGSRDWWRNLVAPVIGFAILAYVLLNAQLQAKWLGLIWFMLGVAALAVLIALGRRPELALVEEEVR